MIVGKYKVTVCVADFRFNLFYYVSDEMGEVTLSHEEIFDYYKLFIVAVNSLGLRKEFLTLWWKQAMSSSYEPAPEYLHGDCIIHSYPPYNFTSALVHMCIAFLRVCTECPTQPIVPEYWQDENSPLLYRNYRYEYGDYYIEGICNKILT